MTSFSLWGHDLPLTAFRSEQRVTHDVLDDAATAGGAGVVGPYGQVLGAARDQASGIGVVQRDFRFWLT